MISNTFQLNRPHKHILARRAVLLRQQISAFQSSCQLVLSQHFVMSHHSLIAVQGSQCADDKVNMINLRTGLKYDCVH